MNKSAAIALAGRHNATANNTVAVVTRSGHWAFPRTTTGHDQVWHWDVVIKYEVDYRLGRVTCGHCHRSWCERTDPTPSAQCPWCNGRGYSTAPIA